MCGGLKTAQHTTHMRKIRWSYAITRLTVHMTCGLMSDLEIFAISCRKRTWSYMTPNYIPQNSDLNSHDTEVHCMMLTYKNIQIKNPHSYKAISIPLYTPFCMPC